MKTQMKLFVKKKEKYHTLDRGLLAEAISTHLGPTFLTKETGYHSIHEAIHLNDVLEIRVLHIYYAHSYLVHYYTMEIETYVENIQMAKYRFDLDLQMDSNKYRSWHCISANIIHKMPNQFIDLMNEWSAKTVSEFNKEQEKIKQTEETQKRNTFEKEEDILDKYR